MPDGHMMKPSKKKPMSAEAFTESNTASDRLRSVVERIERLEEERKALGNDIKDIYTEASSAGYDAKVLRQLIRIRKQDPDQVESDEHLLDTYKHALGMAR